MRGLLLAAGRGRRMGVATEDRPKALLHVGGRPLASWQLEAFAGAGIREIAVVRGYRGEALGFDATYVDHPRWEETSSAASLACAREWLAVADCLVSYTDLVYPAEAIRLLRDAGGDLALLYDTRWLELWRRRFDDPLEDAETFRAGADGLLLEIGGRPRRLGEVRGQYMGLFKLTPRGAQRLLARFDALDPAARDRADMTSLFRLLLTQGERIRAVPYSGWWCEIDGPRDLAVAERIAAASVRP